MAAIASAKRVLSVGSGRKYMKGAVNVDLTPETHPDVVHDLNVLPWPFDASSFDEIHAYDVVEHLDDVVKTLKEFHRVGRPGAVVHLTIPHFSSDGAFTDPTHRHYFGARTFEYFTEGHPNAFYSDARFNVLTRDIVFRPSLLNKLVQRFANRHPALYEERWTWVFPAWFLFVRLEVVKKASGKEIGSAAKSG